VLVFDPIILKTESADKQMNPKSGEELKEWTEAK
jgi:hypothetical protein